MRVLMLGWEFPPFISGGLGTACHGLTKAMSAMGVDVTFVLPKAVDRSFASHVKLISPDGGGGSGGGGAAGAPGQASAPGRGGAPGQTPAGVQTYKLDDLEHVTFKAIPSRMVNPYARPEEEKAVNGVRSSAAKGSAGVASSAEAPSGAAGRSERGAMFADNGAIHVSGGGGGGGSGNDYDGDLMGIVQRYRSMALALTRGENFDVIHAHDWMTYPAGLAIARASGKPLVVHVHSTEFDRAGENVHTQIYDIERRGMHGAMRAICVSQLTKNIVVHRYSVPTEKVDVVYNGIDMNGDAVEPKGRIEKDDKIVLFLGRITMQKGPEYFVAAAKKVLERYEKVKFVMAGSGDMVRRVIELASEMGIGHKVLFTGFLRGKDVERVFSMADVYVMPSVSEPFGITPLEAIRHDVPVIISKNSGVAEVLSHALKVDFWDVDEMANKIIAVLKHPPLSNTLREHADLEVRRLTWEGAAIRCVDVYRRAIEDVAAVHGVPVRR